MLSISKLRTICCELYTKIQKMKAIHNDLLLLGGDALGDALGNLFRLVAQGLGRLPGLVKSGSQLVTHEEFYLDWFHLSLLVLL